MNILITGIAGFIGSSLANFIAQNQSEHTVIGIDDLSGGYMENVLPNIKVYKLNCSDPRVSKVFTDHKIDICFHLGSYASEGRSNSIRSFIHFNNTISTCNIINNCVNHKAKLIFASSVAVYSGEPPYFEYTVPNPIDEYGLSKLMSEKSIEIAGKTQGLEWCIVRPRNVYGPGQSIFDPSRNLFGILCYNALNNLPIKIFGDGSQTRSFTYINDILEPLWNCRKHYNRVFNLGSEIVYSVKHAVEIFSEITGYNNIVNVEPRHEVKDAYCNTDLCVAELGYKNLTGLGAGIENMWVWAKQQKMRPLLIPPPLEVSVNIHSSLL